MRSICDQPVNYIDPSGYFAMDDYSNASLGINTKGKAVAKPSDYSNKSLGINKYGKAS